jgi:hypothetical protein
VIKIQNALQDNPFLSNQEMTSFLVLFDEVVREHIHFHKLRKVKYIHGLLKYPDIWPDDLDLFYFIKPEYLDMLRKKEIYFVFDASTEGFSPVIDKPFFKILFNNCKLHNVDPRQILYVSSNLYDERNLSKFCKERSIEEKINVFSFVAFEYAIQHRHGFVDTKKYLDNKLKTVSHTFKDRYFSSLSRINRSHRTKATFLLCQEEISKQALISHDTVDPVSVEHLFRNYDQQKVKDWISQLPLTVDRKDFTTNWALDNDYDQIHNQTLFQIVNETEANDKYNTALFYSEKTFRPISQLQPFIIYGQQYCNKYLKNIGYKTYEDWFDYSFDNEPDDTKRYELLLDSIKKTCDMLDQMSADEKVNWRFKNQQILINNYDTLFFKSYSKDKMFQFLVEFSKPHSK